MTVGGAKSAPIPAYAVVYDGDCRVCGRLIGLLRRWDHRGRFELLPFQRPGVPGRFSWIPPEAFREAMQLVGPGGQTWAGAAAIEKMLDLLPAGWLLGWIFGVPVLGRLADRFYRWFARNRYHFGCGDHCSLRAPR